MSVNRKRVKLSYINVMRNYTAITKNEGDFVILTWENVHALLLKSSVKLYILLLVNTNNRP